jgi:hypothetical protein
MLSFLGQEGNEGQKNGICKKHAGVKNEKGIREIVFFLLVLPIGNEGSESYRTSGTTFV